MIETYQDILQAVYHLGEEGSYSQIMAQHLYPDGSGVMHVPQPTFDKFRDILFISTCFLNFYLDFLTFLRKLESQGR